MKSFLGRVIYISLFLTLFFALAGAAYAANCWTYDDDQSGCDGQSDCQWKGDSWGSWCEEIGCWNFWSQTDCGNSVASINKSCTWATGASGWCEELDCWQLRGTNNATCEGNNLGLACNWEEMCMGAGGAANCWEYSDNNSCLAVEGCVWGDCYRKGCWEAASLSECGILTGYNGRACSWNSQDSYCFESGCWDYGNQTSCQGNDCTWAYGYCSDPWCDDWSYTNSSACANNSAGLNCNWDGPTQRCETRACWNYGTQNNCEAINDSGLTCIWNQDDTGWCEGVECWTFDNITQNGAANETDCVNNTANLSCLWDGNGGWCYKDVDSAMSCGNITSERDCMDTFYCWWDWTGSTCNDPEWGVGDFADTGFFSVWNPGCYIFDNDEDTCGYIDGCSWSSGACDGLGTNGIACANITNSSLCNEIPTLNTCCTWSAGACTSNWAEQGCWNQMDAMPEGATYCEDYNAYDSETLCTQIAGTPWFMPCKWNNGTKHCEFNAADVFGGTTGGIGFEKIDNKRNCESASGKWVKDSYCEGNKSVSAGRCEHKFNDGGNCNQKCYACDYNTDASNYTSLATAKTSCENSKAGLPPGAPDDAGGWCVFNAFSAQADDGRWGECKQNENFKATGGKKCSSSNCGACTFLGKVSDGSAAQVCSSAGCKWFVDPLDATNGWCGDSSDKSCAEKCEKCYDSTSCRETGGGSGECRWDDSTLVCTPSAGAGAMEICWDGVDNDANGNIDCADSKCFSDPFCGGGMMMGDFGVDCFGFDTNSTCESNSCYWVNETWGSWCDMPGMECFKRDGTNETYCVDDGANNDTCEWHSSGSGHCSFDHSLGDVCMGFTNSTLCDANDNCAWMTDNWCAGGGGWCDPDPLYNGNTWYDCVQYDDDGNATCEAAGTAGGNGIMPCRWYSDPWCESQGADAGFCDFTGFSCMQYENMSACGEQTTCFWNADPYSPDGGWCDIKCYDPSLSSSGACTGTEITSSISCSWESGFCDPKGFGGMMGGGGAGGGGMGASCFMYDGNETGCNAQLGCTFFNESSEAQFCDIDFSTNCPQFSFNETTCNEQAQCKYNTEMQFCDENPFECHWNSTLNSNENACNAHSLCAWTNWGCEPICFNQSVATSELCLAVGGGVCSWKSGWCGSETEAVMFKDMTKGAPVMLGGDACPESGFNTEVDICGFGMKDSGEGWGLGINVQDISTAAICNGVYTSTGSGTGTNQTKFFWYLDADGNNTNNCPAKDNAAMTGFEFYFKYLANYSLSTGSTDETFNAYKCVNGEWGVADIKLSSKKQFMCQEINGGMVMVNKDDLNKYPALFVPGSDFRVYVATANLTGNVTDPTDTANPGYASPGAIDFKMECCWDPGADCDSDSLASQDDPDCESILSTGFVQHEECLNGIDDDNDGLTDCFDPACACEESDCADLPKCAGIGVNAAGYVDTTAPKLEAIRVEKYTDGVLVLYDTDEPANGTLTLYQTSATCDESVNGKITVVDSGLNYTNVRDYKVWHDAELNDLTLGYPLSAGNAYYYKLTVCDQDANCAVSACLDFTTAAAAASCYFCDFVTRLSVPSGWTVSYDVDRDGTFEHIQGQVCGSNSGMKTNYTQGRSVDILLNKDDNSTWIKFINARLTRSGLNWKTRDIQTDGITAGATGTVGYTGLPPNTRDKIINNLHPETCHMKIAGTANELWHCDDTRTNCYEIANAESNYLNQSTSDYQTWEIPYCEFSVWASGDLSSSVDSDDSSSTAGGGGGGGGAIAANCTESWTCSGWSDCTDDKKTRTCTDSNNCGTVVDKPNLESACEEGAEAQAQPPAEPGTKIGEVKTNDGAEWKWDGAKWVMKGTEGYDKITGDTVKPLDKVTEIIKSKLWLWWIVGLVVLLVVVGAVVFYYYKQKK